MSTPNTFSYSFLGGESRVGKLKIIGQYRICVPSPFNKICGNSFRLHIAVPEDLLLKRCVDTFPNFWRPSPLFSIKFPLPGLHTAAGRNLKKLYQPPYVPRVQSSGSLRASGGGSSIPREAFCPLKNRSKPKRNMVSQPFFQGIVRLRECIFGRLMMSEVRLWFLFLFGWVHWKMLGG